MIRLLEMQTIMCLRLGEAIDAKDFSAVYSWKIYKKRKNPSFDECYQWKMRDMWLA